VELEVRTDVQVTLLTTIVMDKAVDCGEIINDIKLTEKHGQIG